MGNQVQRNVRNIGDIIIEKYHNHLSSDFEANKLLVNRLISYEQNLIVITPMYDPSVQYDLKKLRNKIAGYVTCKYNKLQKEEKFDAYSPSGSRAGPRPSKKKGKFKKTDFKRRPIQAGQLELLLTSRQQHQ